MSKLVGYLRLMRPVNCLMMGFAVVVGAALANVNVLVVELQQLLVGFITGFVLTGSSMAINDYYDREIDAVNEPKRPIPSGLIKPDEALTFALTLAVLVFVVTFLTNELSFVIAIVTWLISLAYTTFGKRRGLSGNFLVSACVVAPIIYGNAVVVNTISLNVLIFVLMIFLSNTGREITKGIVDVQGDKLQNVKTLAVRYGEKTAVVTAMFFYLLAVLLTPIPYFLHLVSFWFIPLVAITDFGLVASSFSLLKNHSRENARKVKNTVLLWFIVGLLAFTVGALR